MPRFHYDERAQCGEPTDYAEPPPDPPTLHERLEALLVQLRLDYARDPAHYRDPAPMEAAARILEVGSIVPLGPMLYAVRDVLGTPATVSISARTCSCGADSIRGPCIHMAAVDLLHYLDYSDEESV